MLKVRLVRSRASKMIPRGGRLLGEVEEYFVETMVPATRLCSPAKFSNTRPWSRTSLCLALGIRRSQSAGL